MGSPSTSSQSRRWADYTDDEDEEVPRRSYCEVLRRGSPPGCSDVVRAPSPPSAMGGTRSSPSAPRGVVPPAAAAAVGGRWAVDDNARRMESLITAPAQAPVPGARPAAQGARPWTSARGCKRPRNQSAMLPAWTVRSGIPSNLAGACFNCTRTCHTSAECTFETVCLRCGEEGHHARACPQNRQAGGDRRGGPGAGLGFPTQQRPGPRGQGRAEASAHGAVPPVADLHVEAEPATPVPEAVHDRYQIHAHQRLGLGAPQVQRPEPPPPPPHAGARAPVHQHLGELGRDQPPPPPVLEEVGSSSRQAARGRPMDVDSSRRGRELVRSPSAGRGGSPSRPSHSRGEPHRQLAGARSERTDPPRVQKVNSVFVPRSAEVDATEAALRYAVVGFVSGTQAYIPLSEAGAALVEKVPRAEDNFTIHRSWPGDFMFVCGSRRVCDEVLAADAAQGHDFSIRFTPWNRQLQAMHCRMRYRSHFELKGVPAHAWSRSTAMAVLCSDAWVECLGAASPIARTLEGFR
ncbi:hypothetical protein QYE76_035126 [Lolium multiflorum]|uniref:CCHC-type domain-containing protein n=1 Tax=Lolium multiflorum TaxID=4521 RepID=A0AAD8QYM5_LOLMU|nr:hypothetical protein QYE76_035126 [Lolium multiflorum]